MPRLKKIGLDYFPFDTQWDEKIKALLSIFGNDGLSWIITFWQSAYRDEFGRVNTNKYFGEVLAKDSRNTVEKQSEMIKMALDIKLIKEIEPGIYTSNGIQKRIKEVSSERGAALKRYYANKESTKERIKIPKEIKENIKQSKVKDFGDTSAKYEKPLWRTSFEEYEKQASEAYDRITADAEWMQERKKYHPNLDIRLSLEKAFNDFWGQEAGWAHKKKSKTDIINWDMTFKNALTLKGNQVYEKRI